MKEAARQKKLAYEKTGKNRLEENKAKSKNMKNQTKKAVANSTRKDAEKEFTRLSQKSNNVFKLMKFIKEDQRDIEVNRCMRGKTES